MDNVASLMENWKLTSTGTGTGQCKTGNTGREEAVSGYRCHEWIFFSKSWLQMDTSTGTSTGLQGGKSPTGTGKGGGGEWRPRKPEQPPGERPLPTHGL